MALENQSGHENRVRSNEELLRAIIALSAEIEENQSLNQTVHILRFAWSTNRQISGSIGIENISKIRDCYQLDRRTLGIMVYALSR